MRKSFLLFLLFTIPLLFFSCVDEQNVVMVTEPEGKILVESFPSGAAIYLLGTPTGKVTPDSITSLEGGEYDITLKLQGYSDTTFSVQVYDKLTTSKKIMLRSNTPGGTIIIKSDPANSVIWLNGTETGMVTPDTIRNLAAGSYSFTLKHEGYRDTSFHVVLEDKAVRISETRLVPLTITIVNNIIIRSHPEGANIIVDNVQTSLVTPDTLKNLSEGLHTVKLKKAGFLDTLFQIRAEKGQLLERQITLREEKTPGGTINVSSNPSGALIYIDGNNSGKTTPSAFTDVNPGSYQILLKKEGFRDTLFNVAVVNSATVNKTVNLTVVEQVSAKGSLDVSSDPSGADIYIGNTFTGHSTPWRFDELTAGNYQITLKKSGFQDASFSVNIASGRTTEKDIKLERIDTGPVTVEAGYFKTVFGGLIFSFRFNQDIYLQKVEAEKPKKPATYNVDFKDEFIEKGDTREILVLLDTKGKWDLTFYGKKAGGQQGNFNVKVTIEVK